MNVKKSSLEAIATEKVETWVKDIAGGQRINPITTKAVLQRAREFNDRIRVEWKDDLKSNEGHSFRTLGKKVVRRAEYLHNLCLRIYINALRMDHSHFQQNGVHMDNPIQSAIDQYMEKRNQT